MSDRRDVQRAKRDKLFLKGPIYFAWINKNIDKDVKDYWVERRPGRTSVLHHSLNPNKKTLK